MQPGKENQLKELLARRDFLSSVDIEFWTDFQLQDFLVVVTAHLPELERSKHHSHPIDPVNGDQDSERLANNDDSALGLSVFNPSPVGNHISSTVDRHSASHTRTSSVSRRMPIGQHKATEIHAGSNFNGIVDGIGTSVSTIHGDSTLSSPSVPGSSTTSFVGQEQDMLESDAPAHGIVDLGFEHDSSAPTKDDAAITLAIAERGRLSSVDRVNLDRALRKINPLTTEEDLLSLLRKGADPNANLDIYKQVNNDITAPAIYHAAILNKTDCIRVLLEYGANPTCGSPERDPLAIAVRKYNPQAARILLRAKLEAGDEPNYLTLHTAIKQLWTARSTHLAQNAVWILNLLFDRMDEGLNESPLPWSDLLDVALQPGASGGQDTSTSVGRKIPEAIHILQQKARYELVQHIISKKVQLNVSRPCPAERVPHTPLHCVLAHLQDNEKYDIVELMLEFGADPNFAGTEGSYTPLCLAAARNLEPVVQLLLEGGSKPDSSVVYYAAQAESWNVVEMMLEYRFTETTSMRLPKVPLDPSLTTRILAAGLQFDDSCQNSMIELAVERGDLDVLVGLLPNGFREREHENWHPLRYHALNLAVEAGREDVIKQILVTRDRDSHALVYAASRGWWSIVNDLIESGTTDGFCTRACLAQSRNAYNNLKGAESKVKALTVCKRQKENVCDALPAIYYAILARSSVIVQKLTKDLKIIYGYNTQPHGTLPASAGNILVWKDDKGRTLRSTPILTAMLEYVLCDSNETSLILDIIRILVNGNAWPEFTRYFYHGDGRKKFNIKSYIPDCEKVYPGGGTIQLFWRRLDGLDQVTTAKDFARQLLKHQPLKVKPLVDILEQCEGYRDRRLRPFSISLPLLGSKEG